MSRPLTIALSKGRILDETLPLLAGAGVVPAEDPRESRRLIIEDTAGECRFVIIRAADVPTYVAYGAADLGIAGRDVLMEHGGAGLYEPLDLGIARCRMVVAAAVPVPAPRGRLRVATKYPAITYRHYAARGEQVEIIKLYGSMELAPLVGLADRIVDLVDTGRTLRANGLEAIEPVADISARLVVNRAAMKIRHTAVRALLARLQGQVAEAGA